MLAFHRFKSNRSDIGHGGRCQIQRYKKLEPKLNSISPFSFDRAKRTSPSIVADEPDWHFHGGSWEEDVDFGFFEEDADFLLAPKLHSLKLDFDITKENIEDEDCKGGDYFGD
jgi:hypothetical protein